MDEDLANLLSTIAAFMSAWGAILTAVFTLGLLLAAVGAGVVALRTLRQMQADSAAQARPYVFLQVAPSLAGGEGVWDVLMENGGRSTAANIIVELDRPWPLRGDSDQVTVGLRALFETPQTLAPGQRMRTYWSMPANRQSDPSHEMGLKDAVARVSYSGAGLSGGRFVDTFNLRTTSIGHTPVPADGFDPDDSWEGDRKKYYSVAQAIARSIGELRR